MSNDAFKKMKEKGKEKNNDRKEKRRNKKKKSKMVTSDPFKQINEHLTILSLTQNFIKVTKFYQFQKVLSTSESYINTRELCHVRNSINARHFF